MAEPEPAVAALLSWARAHGAPLPLLTPRGRSLALTADVAAGQPFIELPSALLLHAGSGAAAGGVAAALAGALAALSAEGASEWTQLCLRVAAERAQGAASFWAPYLDALPAAFSDPLWWPPAERAALAETPLAAAVGDQADALRELRVKWGPRVVALCADVLPQPVAAALCDASALRWARSAVATRSFMLPLPGGRSGAAMVPVGDMLDHNPFTGADWRPSGEELPPHAGTDEATEGPPLRIASPVPLPAGTVPALNYGVRSNAQLLLTYGFCLHPNEADRFSVALAAAGGGLAQGARARCLRAAGLGRRAQLSAAAPLPPPLLATLRVLLAPDAALDAVATSAGRPSCPRTEARVALTLRRALADALAAAAQHEPADAATLAAAAATAVRVPRGGGNADADTHEEVDVLGSDAPSFALAAYRRGQARILRAALAALGRHAGEALFAEGVAEQGGAETEAEAAAAAELAAGAEAEAYVAWLTRGGARWPRLSAASVAAGGVPRPGAGWVPPAPLLSSAAAAPGDVLASLPASLCLRADEPAAAAAFAAAAAANDAAAAAAEELGGDAECGLAFALAWHRAAGATSAFAPLLAALATLPPPATSAAVLAPLLSGTTAGAAAHAEAAAAECGDGDGGEAAAQAALRELLAAAGVRAPSAAAAWARAAAARCAVPVSTAPGGPPAPCVVPIAHAVAAGPLWGAVLDARCTADGGVELIATAPLRAGCCLRASPGACDAAALLLGDGSPEAVLAAAAARGGACHALELCLAPQDDDPQAAHKAALLEALGLSGAHYLTPMPPSTPEASRMLTALALCLCDLERDEALTEAAAACLDADASARAAAAAADAADGANVFVAEEERVAVAAAADAAAAAADACAAHTMAALGAPAIRGGALRALRGLLADAAEELAPLDDVAAASLAAAARAAGVGDPWIAAAQQHRAAQAAILDAWVQAAARWDDAARTRGKRGRTAAPATA